jgi:glucose/mannose transport system permease protein
VGADQLTRSGQRAAPRHTHWREQFAWFRGDTRTAFLVLLPSIILVAIFIYGFIAWTGYISLVDWKTAVENYDWVGLKNWKALFGMERFQWNMRNLAIYAAGFMSQCICFGFLLAVLLNQNVRGENVMRSIILLPFAVSAIVTGVAWRWLMQPTTGVNLLLQKVGLANIDFAWASDITWGALSITIASAWQFTGYIMALYLAGLRGISDDVVEAARVDGAGTWQLYRYIVIPLLMPVTFSAVVLTGMGCIRVFDMVTVLKGPAFSTDMLAFHMYQSTFGLYRTSLGATIGFLMLLLSLLLVVPYLRGTRFEEGA